MTKIKDTSDYFAKLAAKQIDKYNSPDYLKQIDPNDYYRIVRGDSRYAPQAHIKKLEDYVTQIKMMAKFNLETSTRVHIEGTKEWYTHRDPRGCFMCDDSQFISVLVSVLQYISKTYPNLTLRPLQEA